MSSTSKLMNLKVANEKVDYVSCIKAVEYLQIY